LKSGSDPNSSASLYNAVMIKTTIVLMPLRGAKYRKPRRKLA
jgi:hypothetical protein